MPTNDTIAAIATPPGKGGIGIVRVSGPLAASTATSILGDLPAERVATFSSFFDEDGTALDEGIAVFFRAPHSFTGEDVLELQGHGGPVVLNLILSRVIKFGARLARPGEFSERAYLNDKLDLTQAEAIADLIESSTADAARGALRSMQGEFSSGVHQIVDALTEFRMFVEAAIDFPEEEIDFLQDPGLIKRINMLISDTRVLSEDAAQGALLREGLTIVLAGRPNAGKSSLMNRLTGKDTSIVTDISGTTRDVIDEHIQIDGLPIKLVDTAGLQQAEDPIELEGVRRALDQINRSELVLLIVDVGAHHKHLAKHIEALLAELPVVSKYLVVLNKSDLWCGEIKDLHHDYVFASTKTNEGLDELKDRIKSSINYNGHEGAFIARTRHIDALRRALEALERGRLVFDQGGSGDLLAEDLRTTQMVLGEITGDFSSDDLLGKIFSTFCIGK